MVEEQVSTIRERLKQPLPGIPAQLKMSPQNRITTFSDLPSKKAGVLLLLYPKVNDLNVIFTKRTIYDGPHSGQISLPGGKFETFDNQMSKS